MGCHNIISDKDIEEIFKNIKFIKEIHCLSECPDIDEKTAHIILYDKDDSVLSDSQFACEHHMHAICRTYYASKPLINSTQTAKVAEHKLLALKEKYRNKKISKLLKENEDRIYLRNNIKQVWLKASWDGLITWSRIGYIFVDPSLENDFVSLWRRYVNDEFILEENEYLRLMKIDKLSDIPQKYLLPKESSIEPFSTWILKKKKIRLAKMYRDIS